MYQRISFITEDQVIISGDYYSVQSPRGVVLLLHMMPAVKESWQGLVKVLNASNFSALAIDLRGHGESVDKIDGTRLNYNKFTDSEHQASSQDVRGAIVWLHAKGAKDSKIAVVGASIGANLALQALVQTAEIPTAVLLSPGLDFRGVKTDLLVKKLRAPKTFLCVASLDDKYSFDTCRTLRQETPLGVRNENLELSDAGHGTHIFSAEPEMMQRVVEWVDEMIR